MKKIAFLVGICVFLLLFQSSSFAADLDMGYISLGKIFEGYKKVADSNKEIDKVKNELKAKVDEINKLKEGFDTLSQEAKEERKNQMLAKQEEIRKRTFEVRKNEDRILREILKDIEKVSIELRKKKKLDYIIDDRLVIAGPDKMDLTDEILKMLNERYKGK